MAFQVEDGYRKSVHHEDAWLDTTKTAGSNLKCTSGIIIIVIISIIIYYYYYCYYYSLSLPLT